MKTRNVATTLIAAAIAVAALTGCTANSTPHPPTATPTAAATSGARGAVTAISHQPGTNKDAVGARKDVGESTCDSTASGSTFKGKVTNPEKSAQSYRIYVSVIDGSNTLGVKEIDVSKVDGRAKAEWNGTIDAGSRTARCVLRVERTAAS